MNEDPHMPGETHHSLLRRGETTSPLLANEVAELGFLRGSWSLVTLAGGILGWISLIAVVVILAFAFGQVRS